MEAVKIQKVGFPSTYHIDYQAHVSYIGWQGWVSDGQTAGTTGQGKAIEAIQIKLRGFPSNYHVKYRAYVQNSGWQSWVEDGATAGTTGQGRVLEAIQLSIIYSVNPTIAMSPMFGIPGTTFTVNGQGLTPNSTVTSHLKKPDGTECSILQIPTYDQGEYTWPIDSAAFDSGTYYHWVFDDNTGKRSNTVGFDVIMADLVILAPIAENRVGKAPFYPLLSIKRFHTIRSDEGRQSSKILQGPRS